MSSDDSKASSEEVDCPRGCGTMEYRNLGYCYKHKETYKPIEKIDFEEKSN